MLNTVARSGERGGGDGGPLADAHQVVETSQWKQDVPKFSVTTAVNTYVHVMYMLFVFNAFA